MRFLPRDVAGRAKIRTPPSHPLPLLQHASPAAPRNVLASPKRGRFTVNSWLRNAEAFVISTSSSSQSSHFSPFSLLQSRPCSSERPDEEEDHNEALSHETLENEDADGALQVSQENLKQERVAEEEEDEEGRFSRKLYGIEKGLPPKVVAEFTDAVSLCKLKSTDINKLFNLREEDQARYLPEGLPQCLVKEFESSKGRGLLLREPVLRLISHIHSLVETTDFFELDKLNAVGESGSHNGMGMPDGLALNAGSQELATEQFQSNGQEDTLSEAINFMGTSGLEKKLATSDNLDTRGETKGNDPSHRSDANACNASEFSIELSEIKDKEDEPNEPTNFDLNIKIENQQPTFDENATSFSFNERRRQKKLRRFLNYADLGSRKQIVLDGMPGCGKSVALAMLVLWARMKGWLVVYVPSGKTWTQGGYFYKNEVTKLWDTPRQAILVLENMIKSHGNILGSIRCRILDPITLGEAPGIGTLRGPQTVPVKHISTLKDLIQFGIQTPHAAVGVVVRIRKELSLVDEVPVLLAIDEFNSWFTLSQYHESSSEFARNPIHAKELAMVQAYRDMMCDKPIIVGAFSHSTAVGKLPKQLPVVPYWAKVFLDRYSYHEASIMIKYYRSQIKAKLKTGRRMRRMLYVLTNGNGNELRNIAMMRGGL